MGQIHSAEVTADRQGHNPGGPVAFCHATTDGFQTGHEVGGGGPQEPDAPATGNGCGHGWVRNQGVLRRVAELLLVLDRGRQLGHPSDELVQEDISPY